MDWHLLRFNISGSQALPSAVAASTSDPGLLEGGIMPATIALTTLNGSKEHQEIQTENLSEHHWSRSTIAVFILDLITIACIVWLLTR